MINNILIIGKKGFIGSNLEHYLSKYFHTKKFSFEKIMQKNQSFFDKYDYVINTSIHPKYIKKKYEKKYDLDLRFVSKFKNIKFKYIFLSTRKIYQTKENITEKSILMPNSFYAKNKVVTELFLKKILKRRLISLRVSNVLGNRIFRNGRQSHKVFLDNFKILRKKKRKIVVNNDFKDFITINQFCKVIKKIIDKNINGTFNVSLGKKIFISELIGWLDKNFLKKIIFSKTQTDSFTLANKKLLKRIKISLTKNQVKIFCKKIKFVYR